jgi:hypothetical protein
VLWAAAARGGAMPQRSYANFGRIAWISFDPTYPHRERGTVICAAPLRRRRARRPAPLCNTIIDTNRQIMQTVSMSWLAIE